MFLRNFDKVSNQNLKILLIQLTRKIGASGTEQKLKVRDHCRPVMAGVLPATGLLPVGPGEMAEVLPVAVAGLLPAVNIPGPGKVAVDILLAAVDIFLAVVKGVPAVNIPGPGEVAVDVLLAAVKGVPVVEVHPAEVLGARVPGRALAVCAARTLAAPVHPGDAAMTIFGPHRY